MAFNKRFGWHSGTLNCKDAKLKGDLYVQDDIIFSDVDAGTLGVTGGIDMDSTTSAIGIAMGGTFSTACIEIDGTLTGRAIRIGKKNLDGTSNDGSLQIKSGSAVDTEPAQNYLFGLFTKVSASEAAITDELRSTWIRTRVNDGCHVGQSAGYGYGVCGAEIQLKVYATSAATNMYSWQNSAVWAQLETQGASGINFKSGSYSQCVLANVGLTSTTTIDSGATVAGVTINSNTASSNVTATGGFYGLLITDITPTHLDFQSGIWIADDVATTGISIGNCTTGLLLDGDFTTGIDINAEAALATGIAIDAEAGVTIDTGIAITTQTTGVITNVMSVTLTTNTTEVFATTVSTGDTVTTGMSFSGAGTYTTGILLDATAIGTGISITGGCTTACIAISGTQAVGIDVSGTFTGHGIHVHGATFASGKRAFRLGDYGTEIEVAGGEGLIRTYAKTSSGSGATALQFHWGIVTCTANLIGSQSQYEVQTTVTGPTSIMGNDIIVGLAATGVIADSATVGDGLVGQRVKIYGSGGQVNGHAVTLWLDNQINVLTPTRTEASILGTTGGSRPDAFIWLNTTSSGWSQLLYLDTTMASFEPFVSTGCNVTVASVPYLKVLVGTTQYGIPLIAI